MRALQPTVGDLHGAEELLLEVVGVLLVELLVRRAERGQRRGELVDRVGDDVQQVLACFGVVVSHAPQTTAQHAVT